MGSDFSWFDILIVLCGVYIIYTTVIMKNSGKINPSVLLGKSITEDMIKDKPGFINFMFPRAMGLGVVTIVCGVLDIFFGSSQVIGLTIIVVFLIVLILYCVQINQARKKFVD